MARIQTYPFDLAPTVNDYVIGTDGDNLNATRNYKVMTFLDYLGTQYNLNSTDMLFEYDDVISTAVGDGYVSTNNYADATILMSGVTNIYVSKLTGFGQLVEDALNSIGDNGLTILFADMGNRNNYGIFEVVSAADVDANTINLTVTATTTLGTLTAGRSMGIRIGIGGGGGSVISDDVYGIGWDADTTNGASKNALYDKIETLVTLDTSQTVTGRKTFSSGGGIVSNEYILIDNDGNNLAMAIPAAETFTTFAGYFHISAAPSNNVRFHWGDGLGGAISTKFDFDNVTVDNTLIVPNSDGTIALTSDIPTISDIAYDASTWNTNTDAATKNAIRDKFESLAYVGLTGNESISGVKTFSNELRANSGILINGTTSNNNVFRFGTANALDAPVATTSYNLIWLDTAGDIWVQRDGTGQGAMNLVNGAGTTTRTHTFPDADGDVAHTSDIPDYVASTSFSPTLTDAGGGATYTYTTTGSNYSRIGDIVRIHIVINVTNSTGAASGNLIVGNLPYVQANFRELLHVEFSGANQSGTNFYSIHASQATVSTANLWFKMQTALDQTNDTILSSWDYSSGGCNIIISGTYQTNDAV